MQVVLTDAEVKELNRVSEHFFLSNTPIPISRVKLVCFLDAKQKETTIWDINNGAAFIPEKIVSVEDDLNIEFISAVEILTNDLGNSATDISDKIRRFDIILGGFCIYAIRFRVLANFYEFLAKFFIATLSYFNKLIEEQTNNVAKEKGLKFSYKYTGLFSTNESEWRKWLSNTFIII